MDGFPVEIRDGSTDRRGIGAPGCPRTQSEGDLRRIAGQGARASTLDIAARKPVVSSGGPRIHPSGSHPSGSLRSGPSSMYISRKHRCRTLHDARSGLLQLSLPSTEPQCGQTVALKRDALCAIVTTDPLHSRRLSPVFFLHRISLLRQNP